ncbi:MAG: glycosyltransferase [Promethearchaeota archaeon]|nr:MAG: glycosyltransferase [Candidatus Lokiarchaeota archaeon]
MSRKIKICLFSHFSYSLYNPKSKIVFGGAEVQLFLLSKELSKEDLFEVHVIMGDSNYGLFRKEKYGSIDMHLVLPIKRNIFNVIIGVINLFLALIKINPDIVIQRGGAIPTGLIAIYCKLFRKNFIFSIAGINDLIMKKNEMFKQIFYKFGIENSNHVIAQRKDQIKLLKERNLNIQKITLIKSGYNIDNFQNIDKEYILWVGRAIALKRPNIFLSLAKDFPNEHFIMICPLSYEKVLFQSIKDKAKKISNLEFIDYVPFNKINQYFKSAKIFINTSLKEGFPNTFIQAVKNGTPIISLKVDPDNVLIKNRIGFSCNDNYYKLKEKIKYLLEHVKEYQEISKNCHKYAKVNHDIRKVANKWKKIIINLFNKS